MACIGALITAIVEPLVIAFGFSLLSLELVLTAFFAIDCFISSRLAYLDEHRMMLISEPEKIQAHYFGLFARVGLFWWDFIALVPWTSLSLLLIGEIESSTTASALVSALSLLRLVKIIRSYRLMSSFEHLIEHHAQGLVWILARNLTYLAFILHLSACLFWFIARAEGFSDDSWVGQFSPSSDLEQYPIKGYGLSLYFVMATFATVGFGDIRPSTTPEVAFVTIFIFINVAISAYIIGSITLVVVRSDQLKTSQRQTLNVLSKFCKSHKLPSGLKEAIGEHVKHASKSEESSDELLILSSLPTSLKLRVLRHLHLPQLNRCYLLKGVSSKTIDALLAASRFETYLPSTEIIHEEDSVPDLFIVLKGSVEGSEGSQYGPGDPFAESSFFTHSSSNDESFVTYDQGLTRLLLISQSAFDSVVLEKDHQIIFSNLLQRCEDKARRSGGSVQIPMSSSPQHQQQSGMGRGITSMFSREQRQSVVEAMRVRALVSQHLQELNQARIYKFLSAASRNDEAVLSSMIQQGMDVNSLDYDCRSALMLAASKGNLQSMQVLLQSGASTDLVDSAGCNALMDACKQGSSQSCDLLMQYGASLSSIDPSVLAGVLCRAVSDCDGRLLTRMIHSGADCGACDYDSRTALHIAASDGNLAMAKLLLDGGAPLAVSDRFGCTPLDEARRAGAGSVVDFLTQRVTEAEAKASLDKFLLNQTTMMLNACSSGNVAMVKHLLEAKGCAPDVADYDGRTGLHLAASKGFIDIVSLLLDWGGNPKRKDNFGHDCHDEARRQGQKEIEEFLSRKYSL